MDKMVVYKSPPLSGEVTVGGAKNSALILLFSSLLAEGEHVFSNVPDLADIESAAKLLQSLGCETYREKNIFPRSSHFNRSPPANAPRQASDKHGREEMKEPLNEQQTAVTGEIWIDTIPLQEWFQDYLIMALNGESFKDGLYDADL